MGVNTQDQQQLPPTTTASGMPRVVIIGDGQLARMMHPAAAELGLAPRLLAGAADSSAAQVMGDVVLGDYTKLADLKRASAGAAAVTFDHEHVPPEHLKALISEGIACHPTPAALIYAQDKLFMRRKLADIGAPVPEFSPIDSVEQATEFFHRVDGAVCLKARRGGYDGHGVWFPATLEELQSQVTQLLERNTPLMAEKKLTLNRELSALLARTPSGTVRSWPIAQSVQKDGICFMATAPAPDVPAEIEKLAHRIATELQVTGVLAVELFDTPEGIFVNELAMRPHNTGHWTQDGSLTSQFEQHIRAVLDWPLGATTLSAPATAMANVLGADTDPAMPVPERMRHVWEKYPHAKIHYYGKQWRPGRKLGHVNVSADTATAAQQQAREAAHFLVHAQWPTSPHN